jgi:hypothetical protein
VSVSVSKRTFLAWSSFFSSRKFSMMPLWTTASFSVACGWALVSFGAAVGRPAGVADADGAGQRRLNQLQLQVDELALRPPPLQPPRFQGGDAGRIVAAVFQPLQRVHHLAGDRVLAQDPDNAAHGMIRLSRVASARSYPDGCGRSSHVR